MKKILFLLTILTNSYIYAQIDIAEMIRKEYTSIELEQLNCEIGEQSFKIDTSLGQIVVYSADGKSNQIVRVYKKDGKIYDFSAKYPINIHYISGVYSVRLSPKMESQVLLVSFLEGASGLSANMTFGILFDMHNNDIQYLSTWGMSEKNICDIDGDSVYEFLSIDLVMRENQYILVPNIFALDTTGRFTINKTKKQEILYTYTLEGVCEKQTIRSDCDVSFLEIPSVISAEKYQKP